MVVVYHSSFYAKEYRAGFQMLDRAVYSLVAYLWLGVPIFFVISGYCISATCDASRRKHHSAREYFWRRYRRIFPPFWIMVAVSAAVIAVSGTVLGERLFTDNVHPIAYPSALSVSQWLGNLSLTESWRPLFGGAPQQYFLGHAWSLCYEEQFYVVCGVLLFTAPTKFFRNSLFVTAVSVIAAATAYFVGLNIQGFFFDGRWLNFALGMLVYWTINYAETNSASWIKRVLFVVALVALAGSAGFRSVRVFLLSGVGVEIVVGLLFAVALLALHSKDTQIAESRILSPITWCGAMCYSLYLSHWTLVKPISNWLWHHGFNSARATFLFTIPLCVVCSVLVARIFHVTVERRFMNTRPEPGVAAAASAR